MSLNRVGLCHWVYFVALSAVFVNGCASPGDGSRSRDDDRFASRDDYSDSSFDRDYRSNDDFDSNDNVHHDDFGDPIASEEDVDEKEFLRQYMTHRRAQAEIRGTVGLPLDNAFELAYGAGAKFEIEMFKNLFTGVEIDYFEQDVDSATGLGNLASREAIDFYDSLERYNFLVVFDYDFPLAVPSDDIGELTIRIGLGLGLAVIQGEENQSALQDFEVENVYSFLAQPSVETRWRVWEHGHVVAGVSYNYVAENRIQIDTAGDRREVDDDIQFDTFNLYVGFAFEW